MKLELKHIAPYLPYGIQMYYRYGNEYFIEDISGLDPDCCRINGDVQYFPLDHKPILRPLSDLSKPEYMIRLNSLTPYLQKLIIELAPRGLLSASLLKLDVYDFLVLFEMHIDVFGLIHAGLAIDINTLKP